LTQVARDLHSDLANCTGLLIGTGEMGEMLATSLVSTGLAHLVAIDPDLSRAESMAQTLNSHVGRIEELAELLEKSDIVITSMNSRRFTLTRDTIKMATARRRRKPILIIDTGVPGDVDFSMEELDDAFLYTLDDLEKVTREGMVTREKETENAWNIIQDELNGVFCEQEESINTKAVGVSDNFIETLRQKALTDSLGDADKATKLFFQSLKKHETKS
jgi:glutamyl-tRNA reductase